MEAITKTEKPVQKDEKKVQDQKPKKKILITQVKHPLLKVKEILNIMINEGEELPPQILKELGRVRDVAWKLFIEEQERLDSKVQ